MSQRSILFVAYDELIVEEIRAALMPHFPEGRAELHTDFLDPWALAREDIRSEQERLCRRLEHASLMVLGFTGVYERDYWAILSASLAKRRCGLILRSGDRTKIAGLSVIHYRMPFSFVVAVGSMRSRQLQEMFPGIPFLCDITSMVEPGKQICTFIAKSANVAETG
jgi:hypothetical protein